MNNTSAANISRENGSGLSKNVPSKAEGIVWCSIHALLFVFIVVGNLLTVILFALYKKLRKRSLFLVINMAFADLMLGALSLPLHIYTFLGTNYRLWTGSINVPIGYLFQIADSVSLLASLISAAFISCERFYAIYRPFKHRTLAVRTYGVVIFVVWTQAALHTGLGLSGNLGKHNMYILIVLVLTPTIIICGCNIAIWIKFQHGSVALQQQNRNLQNERLTKTLVFVSILALLCWLPVVIYTGLDGQGVVIPRRYFIIVRFLNYCNAFINPVVYALRIPEFRQALALCCVRRRTVVNTENIELRNNKAAPLTPATQLRTLQTDSTHIQLKFDEEVMDTKL